MNIASASNAVMRIADVARSVFCVIAADDWCTTCAPACVRRQHRGRRRSQKAAIFDLVVAEFATHQRLLRALLSSVSKAANCRCSAIRNARAGTVGGRDL